LEKQGNSIGINDLLIGICARKEGCSLKTNNKKHFTALQGFQIVDN
jgi:predicted nucleic acid-binding protein